MSKKTFNVTDLTKEIYGNEDTNSGSFISNRKRVERHIKGFQEILGHPQTKFEAPINELKGYANLMRELLENPENDKLLDLLNNRIKKNKRPENSNDEELINSLIALYAKSFAMGIADEQEKTEFNSWINNQITNDPRPKTEENLKILKEIFVEDFLLFQELNSIESYLEFQRNYIEDIKTISAAFREKAHKIIALPECFLEIKKKYPELDTKKTYTNEDIMNLPPDILEELMMLVEVRTSESL